MPIYQLSDKLMFPSVYQAEEGIVAVGGDLSPQRLMLAYRSGIFPCGLMKVTRLYGGVRILVLSYCLKTFIFQNQCSVY